MEKTTVVLAAPALTAGGCGGEPSADEEDLMITGEEGTGELPEKEPVRQDNETAKP